MERRSTRGRHSHADAGSSSPAHVISNAATSPGPGSTVPMPAEMVPEIGVEEVVLNRRGMPARQRKRNRFYFDDDNLITTDTTPRKSSSKSPVKKLKSEEEVPGRSRVEDDDRGRGSRGDAGRSSTKSDIRGQPSFSRNRSDISPAKSRTPKDQPKATSQVRVKRDPDTNSREKPRDEIQSPKRPVGRPRIVVSPSKVPQPIKIKKEPDAVPRQPTKAEREKERLLQEKQREKERAAKEKERLLKEKEKKDLKKVDKERVKEKERDYQVPSSPTRRSRNSSPPLYPVNRVSSPEPMGDNSRPSIDKKTAHDISLRLRNVLKLPKAHKWVCYEWFYSNIDKVLFEGENDFQICLKESFPTLKARKCTRVEWCKIRRMMGKPRRCSQAFFDEEREELARRRQKIRMIQQRKMTDFNYKELPDEIPLQLVIGTKVTARLRRPQDGLFTGTIEGVDTSNNTYRITFDRSGLGTHSIPDYEVLSNDNPETVSTSSFALKIPRRSYGGFAGGNFKFNSAALLSEDGALGGMPKSPFPVDGMLGGFPIRLLDMIVRLSKLLKAKREKIMQLKELNVEAEKMYSYSKHINNDYRMRYARCVLDLDSMNKEMSMYLEGIQQYCLDIAPDHGANQMIVPEHIQEQCRNEAHLIVDTYNTKQSRNVLNNSKNLNLISQLTSLLLQIKTLGTGERNLYELKSIKDTVREVKASLEGRNVVLFQNRVEIPVNQIQAGLCGSSYPVKATF